MKFTYRSIFFAFAMAAMTSVHATTLDLGLSCMSQAGDLIEVTSINGGTGVSLLVVSKSGRTVDDNNYSPVRETIGPDGSSVLVAEDDVSGTAVQILGLETENVGEIEVYYSNELAGVQYIFDSCDVLD